MSRGESMKHNMRLNHDPFVLIEEGSKTIELRLNDEKRSKIKVGDTIVFEDRTTGKELNVKVIALHPYDNFATLYQYFSPVAMGYREGEKVDPKDMEEYYSKEEQDKYGVLGIEVKVIK